MAEARYRIGTLSRLAGVSPHLVRMWERRYDAFEPDRSGGGARLYSPQDLERLRLLKRAVERGHSIGQIARLNRLELARLTGASAKRVASDEVAAFVEEFIEAARRFDGEHAEELLARASLSFSARSLVFNVYGPLLERVGTEWASGTLCVASEHLASAVVRAGLLGVLRRVPPRAGAELALVATPAGERHELGALLAAVTIAMQGYRVLYLGADLAGLEIARASRAAHASLVALSVLALDVESAVREVRAVTAALPERVDIAVGGAAAAELRGRLPRRVLVLESLAELEHWLQARRSA